MSGRPGRSPLLGPMTTGSGSAMMRRSASASEFPRIQRSPLLQPSPAGMVGGAPMPRPLPAGILGTNMLLGGAAGPPPSSLGSMQGSPLFSSTFIGNDIDNVSLLQLSSSLQSLTGQDERHPSRSGSDSACESVDSDTPLLYSRDLAGDHALAIDPAAVEPHLIRSRSSSREDLVRAGAMPMSVGGAGMSSGSSYGIPLSTSGSFDSLSSGSLYSADPHSYDSGNGLTSYNSIPRSSSNASLTSVAGSGRGVSEAGPHILTSGRDFTGTVASGRDSIGGRHRSHRHHRSENPFRNRLASNGTGSSALVNSWRRRWSHVYDPSYIPTYATADAMRCSVNWKSLCTPAILPVTTMPPPFKVDASSSRHWQSVHQVSVSGALRVH
jgi:hypothetical protein